MFLSVHKEERIVELRQRVERGIAEEYQQGEGKEQAYLLKISNKN